MILHASAFRNTLPLAVLAPLLFLNAGGAPEAQTVGDKFPAELVKFVPYRKAPVFTAAKGQWDAMIRERGWIMKEDNLWKLYYTGYATKDGLRMLGYATSKDGFAGPTPRTCLPIGFSVPQRKRAARSLITADGRPRSPSSRNLPVHSGIPIALKYRGVTKRKLAMAST